MRELKHGEIRLHDEQLPGGFRDIQMLDKLQFSSRAEYACAVLLEKYVPGWRCEYSKTYQVSIGFGRSCDFKVHDVFVEYHVVVFAREFDDKIAFRKFDNAMSKCGPYWRHEIKDALFCEFLERYFRKRKFCIEANPDTRGSELVLAHSPQTFYHQVLKRWGENVPGLKEIQAEFAKLQRA